MFNGLSLCCDKWCDDLLPEHVIFHSSFPQLFWYGEREIREIILLSTVSAGPGLFYPLKVASRPGFILLCLEKKFFPCERSNLREPWQWYSTGCVISVKLPVNTNICRREVLFKGIKCGLLLYFIAFEYPTLHVLLSFSCESVLESLEHKSHVTALDPSHPWVPCMLRNASGK